MAVEEDLSAFYDADHGDAERCQVGGTQVTGIFETSSEVLLGEMLVTAPTLRLPATVVVAERDTCVIRGRSYLVRNVRQLPPDGREHLLVLAQAG